MTSQPISHYRITAKLGEGATCAVYKAEDTRRKDPVAIKFLSLHGAEDPDVRAHFVRRAKAATRLEHESICSVREVSETEGQTFLVMEYLQGHTVKEEIAKRPLDLDEAIDIATQTAYGLGAAHERGIIHGGLQSRKLMLAPRGRVKIIDFGWPPLPGGTNQNMAPEQLLGDETSHRSDIWSLGVILYEMLAQRLPFEGDYRQVVAYMILNGEPATLTSRRSDLPSEIDQVTSKALAKEPAERYQSVADIVVDLQRIKDRSQSLADRDASD